MCGRKTLTKSKLDIICDLSIDEWDPRFTFKEKDQNWFAYQFGFEKKNIAKSNDKLRIEYNWTDYRVYRNKYPITDYYSHNYPLGFWGGPHSEEFYVDYKLPVRNLDLFISYSYSIRGELSDSMSINQYDEELYYERYTGITEEKNKLSLFIIKELIKGFYLWFGYEYINWKNAGFDPINQDLIEFQDVKKNSFNLRLFYNFDIDRRYGKNLLADGISRGWKFPIPLK